MPASDKFDLLCCEVAAVFFSLRRLCFPLPCKMTPDITLLTQQIATIHRENPQRNNLWADVLGTVGELFGSSTTESPRVAFNMLGRDSWELAPPPDIQRYGDSNLRSFWSAAPRSMDRARRRWQRANLSPVSGGQGPLTIANGTVLRIPSYDAMVPDLPQGSLSVHPPIGLVDSSSESEH